MVRIWVRNRLRCKTASATCLLALRRTVIRIDINKGGINVFAFAIHFDSTGRDGQGRSNGKGDGKEVSVLLVVFENHILDALAIIG